MGCGDSDIKDKTMKGLVRLIEESLEAKLKGYAEPDSDFLKDSRTGIVIYMTWCPPLEELSKKTRSELGKVKCEYEAIKQKYETLITAEAHSPMKDIDNKDVVTTGGSKPLYFQPRDFQRGLKIISQIGEPVQKDKLSFVSLVRQIEDALQKGGEPQEVVDAAVRAINPGTRLRCYLEGLSDLTLPRLKRILLTHFQEKSVSDLYSKLSPLIQEPILEKVDVRDEDLIQQMNVVVSEESETKSKMHASQGERGTINQGATAKEINPRGKRALGKSSS